MRLGVPAVLLTLLAILVVAPGGTAKPRKPRHHRQPAPSVALAPPATPAVVAENAQPGTPGWLGPEARGRTAEVYASATDALPGDSVSIYVSAEPSADYRVLVYRLGWYAGVGARLLACLPSCDGSADATTQPMPAPDVDGKVVANWPASGTIQVGSSWVSGYYLVRVLLLTGPGAGESATTYFVVNEPTPSAHMLVQVPMNTWQAYNNWGGKSLYPFSLDGIRGRRVSFDRPYDWSWRGAQSPLGWELPLVRFIERQGYDVAYQSDVYTDAHPRSLLVHRLDVVAGHDEYWSRRMRDGWEAARDHGVNLAFMGANAAYWQVLLEDGGRTVMSYKSGADPNPDPWSRTDLFRALSPPRYECQLIGIQTQGGTQTWQDGDYTVQPDVLDDPWLHGTGFQAGDSVRGVVSREVDTIPGTMTSTNSCGNELTVFFHREAGGEGYGNADAVRYTAPSMARVFAAGSLNFAWGLDDIAEDPHMGHGLVDPRLQRFVDNAFASMGAY